AGFFGSWTPGAEDDLPSGGRASAPGVATTLTSIGRGRACLEPDRAIGLPSAHTFASSRVYSRSAVVARRDAQLPFGGLHDRQPSRPKDVGGAGPHASKGREGGGRPRFRGGGRVQLRPRAGESGDGSPGAQSGCAPHRERKPSRQTRRVGLGGVGSARSLERKARYRLPEVRLHERGRRPQERGPEGRQRSAAGRSEQLQYSGHSSEP